MILQITIKSNYLKVLDSDQKKTDSIGSQHLEKENSNEKVSHFISFFSEEKPKSVLCRTAITPTKNFWPEKTEETPRETTAKKFKRNLGKESEEGCKILYVNSIQLSGRTLHCAHIKGRLQIAKDKIKLN